MPPATSQRRGSIATDTNRRQSGRQPRTSRSGPVNYYARPYGSLGGPVDEPQEQEPPGFFPAITYFADAITALPKEVQRHVSLMKEVEAKVYGPTEALKSLSSRILQLPTPPPRHSDPSTQGLLSLTASNSATASLAGSVINGTAPTVDVRMSDGLDGADSHVDEQAELVRRSHFRDLRQLIGNMIVNLDEKNNVMAEANRVLAQQLSRMDSVMPHVEGEISEEARLGSLTHWAYAENRVKKQPAPVNDRARRDVAATTNLAAAAAAVHDNDIAAARGGTTREGKKSRNNHHVDSDFDDKPATKRGAPATKARREATEQKATGLGITNGASAIAPAKRRKVEKATAAPAMERSASNLKNGRGGNTTPRGTPTAEPVKQRKKPGPAPGFVPVKKRQAAAAAAASNSGANSPANASSPVLSAVQPEISVQRPTSSRIRQNSSTSNLQYSLLAGGERERSRPSSVADNRSVNGANGNGGETREPAVHKNGAQETEQDRMNMDEQDTKQDRATQLKHEDTHMTDAPPPAEATRGRTSKTSTPLNVFNSEGPTGSTGMLRTRSNRGTTAPQRDVSEHEKATAKRPFQSETPDMSSRKKHGHSRKSGSGTHILKQIASFNRSPDMDRHRSIGDPTSDVDTSDDEHNVRDSIRRGTASGSGSASGSVAGGVRSSSRRSVVPRAVSNALAATSAPSIAAALSTTGRTSRASRQRGNDSQPRSTPHSRSRNRTPEVSRPPSLAADDPEAAESELDEPMEEPEQEPEPEPEPPVQQIQDDEDEEDEEDPDEPKYCYCQQGSFGEMIACDNENCTIEWFHLPCTELRSVPGDNVKWYCEQCREAMGHNGRGGKKGRPASRHAGH